MISLDQTWWITWTGMRVAVPCLYVRPSAAITAMLWCWWTAESLSCLNTWVTLGGTLRPWRPGSPTPMHCNSRIKIFISFFFCLSILFWMFFFVFVPGHCTVLQGSCSSLSPSQKDCVCVLLNNESVWLQLRKRRLIPTSSTWLKHVLLHSDQLVHLLQTPLGSAA